MKKKHILILVQVLVIDFSQASAKAVLFWYSISTICNLDKYNLQFLTNTICNFTKHNLEFEDMHLAIVKNTILVLPV